MTPNGITTRPRIGSHTAGALWTPRAPIIVSCLAAVFAAAQTGRDPHQAGSVASMRDEPPARIAVDQPLADSLSLGSAVVHFRTENLRVKPMFGPAAASLSPRVGHLHVRVDDAAWVWAHASEDAVNVTGLAPGAHKIRLQLMNANHQPLDEAAVEFTVPRPQKKVSAATESEDQLSGAAVGPATDQPARLVIDSPVPEPLSRGVIFVPYRTENLNTRPVSEYTRMARIRVTVDQAPWHWEDASGNPIIVQGLAPGSHYILIEHVNPQDRVLDHGTIKVTIPAPASRPEAHLP